MPLTNLTEDEQALVRRCVEAMVKGPFIDDDEFQTILGVYRREAAAVAAGWTEIDEKYEVVDLTINNSLNGLLIWYGWQGANPEAADETLRQWTGATSSQIEQVFDKWRGDHTAT